MKKRTKIFIAVLILLLIPVIIGLDSRLLIRHYRVETDKLEGAVRIALITDLHSCRYGEEQRELIEAVDSGAPDLVMLCGDIFDDRLDDRNTEVFLKDVSEKYPCYYVTGNHEHWSDSEAFDKKMEIAEQCGIKRLSCETETVDVNGVRINICGVDDAASAITASSGKYGDKNEFFGQLAELDGTVDSDSFTILLSHRPEYFEEYIKYDFDLVLCGHAHGGQWRIPYILNGLYAPNQGLFPKYAGGEYEDSGTVMIVSRGLARESTPVPRIYNRPELVIIDCEPN